MTRQELKEVLKRLIARQWESAEGENFLVPLLVGPTQCGKTSLVKELGPEMGAEVIVVLAQAEDPTELLGLGKVIESGGVPRLTRLFPAWAENIALDGKRFIVFLDEFDKAPADVYAGLLTLLRSRRIVNRPLPDVAFVAAANTLDDAGWPPELMARFRFFSVGYDWEYEIQKHGYPEFFGDIIRGRLASEGLPPPEVAGDTPTVWFNLWQDFRTLLPYCSEAQAREVLQSLFRDTGVLEYVWARLRASNITLRYEDLIQPEVVLATVRRLQEGVITPLVLGDDVVKALAHLLREDASDEERKAGTHLYCQLWVSCLRCLSKREELEDASGTALGKYALLFSEQAPQLLVGTRIDVEVAAQYTDMIADAAEYVGQLSKQ